MSECQSVEQFIEVALVVGVVIGLVGLAFMAGFVAARRS